MCPTRCPVDGTSAFFFILFPFFRTIYLVLVFRTLQYGSVELEILMWSLSMIVSQEYKAQNLHLCHLPSICSETLHATKPKIFLQNDKTFILWSRWRKGQLNELPIVFSLPADAPLTVIRDCSDRWRKWFGVFAHMQGRWHKCRF